MLNFIYGIRFIFVTRFKRGTPVYIGNDVTDQCGCQQASMLDCAIYKKIQTLAIATGRLPIMAAQFLSLG